MGCLQPAYSVSDMDPEVLEAKIQMLSEDDSDSLEVPAHVQSVFDDAAKGLSRSEQFRLAALLRAFSDVFSTGPDDIGRTDLVEHEIILKEGANQPLKQPSRRMGREKQESAEQQIKDNCQRGLAEPSNSP